MIPYKFNYAYLRRSGAPAPGVLDGTSWKLPKNKSWSAFGTTIKNYFMNFTFYTSLMDTTPADTVFTDLFINGDVAEGQISRTTQYGIACLSDDAFDINSSGSHAPQITAGSREWTIGKYGFGYNKNQDRYITFINGADSNNEELIGWLNTYCTYLGPVKYDVSYDATNCELDGPSEIKEDEEITVYITPDEGYVIDDVSVTGADYIYEEGSNEISIYDPTDDVEVVVVCEAEEHSDAPEVWVDGDILTIEDSPYIKKEVEFYAVNWTDQDDHTGNFNIPIGERTFDLKDELEPNFYTLEVYGVYDILPYSKTESGYTEWEGESGGTHTITYVAQNCTITGPDEVEDGEDFWVDAEPDEGYHFEMEPDIDGEYDDMGGSMVDCGSIEIYGCHSDLTITVVANPD